MNVRRRSHLGARGQFCDDERAAGVRADHLEGVEIGEQPERLAFAFAENHRNPTQVSGVRFFRPQRARRGYPMRGGAGASRRGFRETSRPTRCRP